MGAAGAFGGLARRRADQQLGISPAVVPAPSGNFIGNLVIVFGTGEVGIFQYSGSPALGNPPILWSTAPGVTTDPYGNALPVTTGGISTARYSGGIPQQVSQLLAGVLNLWGGSPAGYSGPAVVADLPGQATLALTSAATPALPEKMELDLQAGATLGLARFTLGSVWSQYSVTADNAGAQETYHSAAPTLAGWTNNFNYLKLPLGEGNTGASGPNPSLILYDWGFTIANGTVLTGGNIVFPAGTLPAGYFYTGDNKLLPATFTGGGGGGPLYAPLEMTPAGSLHYAGPGFTLTAPGFLYGQAIITTAV